MTQNYLSHHGILGMHWGIRRYQNEDGTLTTAGKKHLSLDTDSLKTKAKKVSEDVAKKAKKVAGTEVAKRGKSAVDVLLNGDTDWMGEHTYSDDAVTEAKNRGKAALERLLYSNEQIENKKFFGEYDF